MSVQRGYYHATTTKLERETSSKPTNFHAPTTAVYTQSTKSSSGPRAAACTKPVQPKVMSPITNHSAQKQKYVTSFSITQKEKIPKIVVLPSIDKDIAGASAKQISAKSPVATTTAPGNKSIRDALKRGKGSQSQARYVSCLHTSLSTEWKKGDSLDKEDTHYKETAQRTSSLEIECNYTERNTGRSAAAKRSSPLEFRVGDKDISNLKNRRRGGNRSTTSLNCNNAQETKDMDKQNVRIQYIPSRKSFTIKNTAVKALGPSANFIETRCQNKAPQRVIRPRMLPKSRFRVKVQKDHHKSVNIADSFNNVSWDKRVKVMEKASRSVVIQDKSPQRSFSMQKASKFERAMKLTNISKK